ncbi:pyridoxal-phosphate dependent enzyme [Micromonospora sp. MED01]|uniref:pyridoxal-phosphate dependent enzyme n=1 Tax=Micromonospora alfalfae TaxID=2911212 RepID=UPI001EE810E9|nr:pyridoxal-phosphate dependent enzyme [Micromonospora alfalfae]MCG5466620.1 pyridoxal-phosphate dependent enzyme [Micromonospora alfalfae]
MTHHLSVTVDDVHAAAKRLAGVAHRTPVLTSRSLDRLVGANVFIKCENLQRVGAFKFRGAYNAVARLDGDARRRGVIAFSSGNHAQAVALASRVLGSCAVVVMPRDAPRSKVTATAAYGAEIVTFDRYTENRFEITAQVAAERGLTVIPPYDHPDVIAGAGTTAVELWDDIDDLDALVVPLGGGGQLAGCATVLRSIAPATRIVGVETETGDKNRQSLRAGQPVRIPVPRTIADGVTGERTGELTFPIIQRLVDDVIVVTDEEIRRAMAFLFDRMKLVVEPSGALGVAALLAGRVRVSRRRVAVVASGGNISASLFGELLAGSASPG